jgi:uncharacterized membrane protein
MFQLPSIPSWDALHPGISHFPIALLLVAPLLILAGLFMTQRRQGLFVMALVLMIAGSLGIYLSASTGDEAKLLAPKTQDVQKAVDLHESVGSAARAVFSGLTVLFAALLYGPGLLKRTLSPRVSGALAWAFLLLYAIGALILMNAAHTGGVLVHTLGVHAKLG